ncbi:MAG TPA: ABC transporter ATP-binding protein [Pantanalinema sp.]
MSQLTYLSSLIRFAFRHNRLFYLVVFLSVLSVFVELLAMNSLFPLASFAGGKPLPASDLTVRALAFLGLTPGIRVFVQLFAFLFMLRLLTQLVSQGLAAYLAKRLHAQLSSQAFSTFVKDYSIEEIESKSIGTFISLAGDEAFRASTVIVTLSTFLSLLLLALFYFAAIAYHSPMTGAAVVAFLLVTFVSMLGIFRKSQALGARKVDESRAVNSFFLDALNGLRAVKAFSAEGYVTGTYRQQIFRYTRTLFLSDFLTHVSRTAPVVILLLVLLAFSIGNPAAFQDGLDFAFWVTMLFFLIRFFPVVGQCLNVFLSILADARIGKNVTALIDRAGDALPQAQRVLDRKVEAVRLTDVSFGYGEGPNVLQQLNLSFEHGHSYAIVGPSGSGKSTLLDLLLKFYTLSEGDIRFDDCSIHALQTESLRARVVLLGQQTTIFNDSVLNNVKLGFEAEPAQVEEACRLACIDAEIMALPRGYQSQLNYQGSNLSGGQRQRIGIARALLRRSDVLILDECTSALDQGTCHAVVENILSHARDRIVIFVTHDPWIVGRVDHVIDLERHEDLTVPGAG